MCVLRHELISYDFTLRCKIEKITADQHCKTTVVQSERQ
jgi:hypothetical protein